MSLYPQFPGGTIVCIGAGPSVTDDDVAYVRGKAPVIAINRSIQKAPWADVAYCADARMWKWLHDDGTLEKVTGVRIGLERKTGGVRDVADYGVHVLHGARDEGLSTTPDVLHSGGHSGYQAINLAVLMGATRILLLGYDGQAAPDKRDEWHAPHPSESKKPNYPAWRDALSGLVQPLKAAGVEVVNCSPRTAYTAFPVRPLREVLSDKAAAA